jgi:hypothetical protein
LDVWGMVEALRWRVGTGVGWMESLRRTHGVALQRHRHAIRATGGSHSSWMEALPCTKTLSLRD